MNSPKAPDAKDPLAPALRLLRAHTPIAIPTETVYGLAAPVSDTQAIKAVFTIKERPLEDPLIVHVSSLDMAKRYALEWSKPCGILAKAFWPGPLTLVVPKSPAVSDLITAKRPRVGLRMPRQPTTLKLIELLGEGLVAPSANKFGRTSPTRAEHVAGQLGSEIFILDDGECALGIESTVCGVDEKKRELLIYRPGLCSPHDLIATLKSHGEAGYRLHYQSSPDAPGQESIHYRPRCPLVVYTQKKAKETALLAVKKKWGEKNCVLSSLPGDPLTAAKGLYQKLQDPSLKADDVLVLYAPLCETDAHWTAIKDRLKRAAALFFDRA